MYGLLNHKITLKIKTKPALPLHLHKSHPSPSFSYPAEQIRSHLLLQNFVHSHNLSFSGINARSASHENEHFSIFSSKHSHIGHRLLSLYDLHFRLHLKLCTVAKQCGGYLRKRFGNEIAKRARIKFELFCWSKIIKGIITAVGFTNLAAYPGYFDRIFTSKRHA